MAKAAKQTAKRPARAKAAAAAGDPVETMLSLVAERGWRGVTLTQIAAGSHLDLSALYAQYASKSDLLAAYARRVDIAMLAALGPAMPDASGHADAARDRLFEAIMARLDVLAAHKPAIRVLLRDLPADPAALLCFLSGGLRRGIDWTLAAAGLDLPGMQGILRRKLLGGIYLDTLRVWLKDDSADLGTTMAHLDKRLNQAIRWLTAGSIISQMRDKFTKN